MTTSDVDIEAGAWLQAHEALQRLAVSHAELDFEEGQRLRAALLAQAHVRLGYGSFVEYIERLFGYSPRLTYEKLRVAEALEQLDGIATALRTGQLAQIQANAFRALRGMGFRETEARQAVFHAASGRAEPLSVESALRGALLDLTNRRVTRAA
mgnify:CR=1 FL=1